MAFSRFKRDIAIPSTAVGILVGAVNNNVIAGLRSNEGSASGLIGGGIVPIRYGVLKHSISYSLISRNSHTDKCPSLCRSWQ